MDLSACLVRIKVRACSHTHCLAPVVIVGTPQSQMMLRLSLGASAVLSRSQISIVPGHDANLISCRS